MKNCSSCLASLILILMGAFVLTSGELHGQIQAQGGFDSARLDSAYWASNGRFTLAPAISLNCLVTGVLDSTPEFQIYDWEGYRLRHDHRMVYREANDSLWHFFDHGDKIGSTAYYHFSNDSAFTSDSVFVAYWFPWSYGDQVDYMSDIAGSSPWLRSLRVAGLSQQGRNVYAYEITDTSWSDCHKKNIVWTGRQHSTEFKQSFVTRGLTDYLLYSTDPLADSVRKYFRFHIYPMINPDGVYNGGGTQNGSDPNRNWMPGGQPGVCTETNVVMADLLAHLGGTVHISIDIHSNAGHRGEWYWWGQLSGPNAAHTTYSASVVDAVAARDSADHGGATVFEDFICCNSFGGVALTAGNWFFNEFGAHSFTLEPSSVPGEPMARLESAGASIARGLAALVTAPSPMKVEPFTTSPLCAGDSTGSIDLGMSGGAGPLTFQWSNGGTTALLNGLPAGSYTVTITDDSACTLLDTLVLSEPPPILSSAILTNPNCNGDSTGSIDLSVLGGIPPYAFNWSNGSLNEDIMGIPAGTYIVTLIDSNACLHSDSFVLSHPPALLISVSSVGNAAWVLATGGTPPYNFQWSDTLAASQDSLFATVPGVYTVTVSDSVGCSVSDSVLVLFTSISNAEWDGFAVYPTFSSGDFEILGREGWRLRVKDSWGRDVIAPFEIPKEGRSMVRISTAGLYLVQADSNGQTVVRWVLIR